MDWEFSKNRFQTVYCWRAIRVCLCLFYESTGDSVGAATVFVMLMIS